MYQLCLVMNELHGLSRFGLVGFVKQEELVVGLVKLKDEKTV